MRSTISIRRRIVPLCLGMLVLCSCGSSFMRPSAARVTPTKEKAVVRFMRATSFGGAIKFTVLDGSRAIGTSVAQAQFDYLADPGHHLFIATAENQDYLEADLEAGKLYYVLTNVYPGIWRARVAFEPVRRGSKRWDAVLNYEKDLEILEADPDKLKAYQDQNNEYLKTLVSTYENELKKQSEYPRLKPEDGR